ncbi:MAG TPA: hypothetical protein VGC85_07465 [Chthoniobacterales bacterium]
MHSHSKEQRDAVRQLLHTVLVRDMSTFNPERFRDWVKDLDRRFRKVSLMISYEISSSRTVTFTVKEVRSKRTTFRFDASTRVPFDHDEASIPVIAA